ncbi:MAG: Tat pathway signal protein [Metallibacterium scheffleri]|uniref:glucoamylase family protein n=1 Tax=Metallibacterium scheffleri TaxID=993689 RepID=UPI0026EFF977|nr:glucoamylase family protein [Metallibacterium scheffleri]MCK9366418.1 Tat pathway signal protein [Metallibacterium scheffleri]
MLKRSAILCATLLVMLPGALLAAPITTLPQHAPFVSTLPARHALPPFFDQLEKRTFDFFWDTTNPANGLAPDHYPGPSFSSIAAVGFALTAYPIGVERGWVTRQQAAQRVLTTLKFFEDAPQGKAAAGESGYKGFYYHFLNMRTGRRWPDIELSSIDTALLMAGVLFDQSYFDRDTPIEKQIRSLANQLYQRVDWTWMQADPPLISMGWTPESGYIPHNWQGYNEAMILYIEALGSPTHPVQKDAWTAWTATYPKFWGDYYGREQLSYGPLFVSQYSQSWIDFRGIQDAFMRAHHSDYFINSRRATESQRDYAIANPMGWTGYGKDLWGLTACDGPGNVVSVNAKGQKRVFWGYTARGAGIVGTQDDGTIAPTAALGSIAFAPRIVIPMVEAMQARYGKSIYGAYGYVDAFNPSFHETDAPLRTGKIVPGAGWVDSERLGIDQGPILLMLENYRSGFVWRVMRKNPYIRRGLQRAGFTGGWLDGKPATQ